MKNLSWGTLCLLMLATLIGCGRTPVSQIIATVKPIETPQPTQTPIPGWVKLEGRGVGMWLPESYAGGDPSVKRDQLLEMLRALGPDYELLVQAVEQNAAGMLFLALDPASFSTVNVTIKDVPADLALDVYLDRYLDVLIKELPFEVRVVERGFVQLDEHQAARLVLEFPETPGYQVMYMIKESNNVWTVNYGSGEDEFDRLLPIFEQSIHTFRIEPE